MERLLRLLEVVIVRYQLIGEGRTGALEINCAKLAQEIWTGAVTSANAATTSLNGVLPADDAFRAAFQRKGDISTQKSQYLLRKIEEQERRNDRPETAGELAPTPINLNELRNFLRCRSRMRQRVPAATRRWQHMRRAAIALGILETA
jgi:hypothetical protein